MVALFFLMSFVNTILDRSALPAARVYSAVCCSHKKLWQIAELYTICSLGNSLVITAVGGGTNVIPFLTVYAVWPCSLVFLVRPFFPSVNLTYT